MAGVLFGGCERQHEIIQPDPIAPTTIAIPDQNDNEADAPSLTLGDIAQAFAQNEAFNVEQSETPAFANAGAIGGLGLRVNGEEVRIFEFESSFDASIHTHVNEHRHHNGAFLIETEYFDAIDFFMDISASTIEEN